MSGYVGGEHEWCTKCDAEIRQAELEKREQKVEDVVIEKGVEPSIVVGDDSIVVSEPKIEREVLVPMRSKLNIGGDTDGEN